MNSRSLMMMHGYKEPYLVERRHNTMVSCFVIRTRITHHWVSEIIEEDTEIIKEVKYA